MLCAVVVNNEQLVVLLCDQRGKEADENHK